MNNDNPPTYYLKVSNREVQTAFRSIIHGWIEDRSFSNSRLENMLQTLISDNIEGFERYAIPSQTKPSMEREFG